MALSSGTKLGPYEILSALGAGGMGEVYRARDTRLARDVAVKVLPVSFAADPERLRRFEQEARAVAALNHPNILAIFDIGQHGETHFLVSELLEGETLREVLRRGVPSHRKAVEYAIQIAHGLGAAHEKDIAHRDLKPDNLFITRDGRVKILDFGLAKTVKVASPSSQTSLATMTSAAPATDVGTVVGTAGYMSPEQVRGSDVDCRTDIFSFGTVFYEMLCGQRAFQRETTAETMTAILKEEPPELLESGRQIPPALDRIVRHCLEKAPAQRFQSARDLAFDLESLSTLTGSGSVSAPPARQPRHWGYLAAIAALLIAATAIGWKLSSLLRPASNAQFHQLTYRRGQLSGNARFTPDGKEVIYSAAWDNPEPELYTVSVDGVGGHQLGIRNARLLSISRRGELAIALSPTDVATFLSPGSLARTDAGGNAPKPEIEDVEAADFTPDGSALAIVRYVPADVMCQLEYPIGKVLYRASALNNLRFSPDGRYLAFIAHDNASDDRGKAIVLRSTGEKVTESPMYESAQGLAWTPSGKQIWITSPLESGAIRALDLSGQTSTPLAVPGRLRIQDIGANGQLLVEQGLTRRGIVVSGNHGELVRDLSWLDFSYLRAISDDGKTILFEEEGSSSNNYEVYVRDVDGSPAVPLGEGYALALSPDKRWALGQKLTDPVHEIWLLPVGPGEARLISPPTLRPLIAANFLSDGKRIVYIANETGHPPRTWMQDLDSKTPRAVTPEGVFGWLVSPDDKWLLTNGRRRAAAALQQAAVVALPGGEVKDIAGLRPDDIIVGWSSDNQLFIGTVDRQRMAFHMNKLNPFTGTRTPFRDLYGPGISGVFPDPPIFTPDGASYGFDYRLRLSDLYIVSGVH
jgi:serine/threonine protein kinase/WD40 repeat protein